MKNIIGVFAIALGLVGLIVFTNSDSLAIENGGDLMEEMPEGYPKAYLAGGCFWCTEYEYRALDGVLYTRVGYMGGHVDNPTYRQVTTGNTGHAEVIEVTFNPNIVTYEDLLEFFLTEGHDPTQLNRQGVDVGTQYRSAIFPVTEEQETLARAVIERIEAQKVHDKPIVTKIEPIATFWVAEGYHQQYYEKYQDANGAPHIRVIMKQGKKK